MGSCTGRKLICLMVVASMAVLTLTACHKTAKAKDEFADSIKAEPITPDSIVGHWKSSDGSQDVYFSAISSDSGSGDVTYVDQRGPFPHQYSIAYVGDGGRSLHLKTVNKDGYTDMETVGVTNQGKTLYRTFDNGSLPIPLQNTYVDDKTHP